MAYNADQFREANRPWEFHFRGRTFLARHVSTPQCQRYDELIASAGPDVRAQVRAIRWVLRIAFPWRFSYLLRGDPVHLILHDLEPANRAQALKDFFACLRGTNPTLPQSLKTNGTLSLAPTRRRRA